MLCIGPKQAILNVYNMLEQIAQDGLFKGLKYTALQSRYVTTSAKKWEEKRKGEHNEVISISEL